MLNANQISALQKKTDLMFVNSVIGHGKVLFQISPDSDESLREVVSARDVEGLIMHLTPEVREVAAELVMNKVMAKYETSGTGIAKVHWHRLCRLDQQLEALIVQSVVMDR